MDGTEEWRPVVGWEDIYEVSSLGRVRRARTGRVLSPTLRKGYPRVALSRRGAPTYRTVHVLVCEAFHGPRPAGMEVRHLEGDRQDNRAEMLAWGTREQNHADAAAHRDRTATHRPPCRHGHTGRTRCKPCASEAMLAHHARKRAAQTAHESASQ